MDFIDNHHYIGKDELHDGKADQINTSYELDKIASKLTHECLLQSAFCFIPKDTNKKPQYSHLITAINTIYWLLKSANNKPVFMIMDGHGLIDTTLGFYYFIGNHDDIKNKLLKLYDDKRSLISNNKEW